MLITFIILMIVGYFLFFYNPSPFTIAKNLGLYTGDPDHDSALDDMINIALASGGSISTGNLNWELTETKNKLTTGQLKNNEIWEVDNTITPAGAFLATVDSTHDDKQGSPDVEGSIYQELTAIVEAGPQFVPGDDEPTNIDAEITQLAVLEATAAAYIPTPSLSAMWGRFNQYRVIKENFYFNN